MSIAGKVIGYLGSVFGLYPRSGGGIVIRQPGGTAGTDELQIVHNGTTVLFSNQDSADDYYFGSSVSNYSVRLGGWNSGNTSNFRNAIQDSVTAGNIWYVAGAGSVGKIYLGGASRTAAIVFRPDGTGGSPDAGITSIATGVIAPVSSTTGGAGAGWFQCTNGRSRVNSAVTNTTITPANITGLSHTLIAGRKYTGRLVLYAAVPTSADGIRIDFDGGTATMTSFVAQGILSDDTSTRKLARTTALATDITDTDLNGDGLVTIELGFVCNVAGTFIPRVAKEADAAGATLTVLANSFLWLEDMP